MERLDKSWKFPSPVPEGYLSDMEDFREIERQVLFGRGIETRKAAQEFLKGEYLQDIDPFKLMQMDRAVDRINQAIDNNESIVIYGDYDADGVSSSALLYLGIRSLGGSASVYFPDRFTEGYGLNLNAIDTIADEGCEVLITVDCGIRAIEEARRAEQLGIDLIITDHHVPGQSLPEAYALINPKQPGDEYPFKSLAGVGVAYKLMQALRNSRGVIANSRDIDLVAIGTVADIVPLVGENRSLVRLGLEQLNQTERIGVQRLIEVAGHQMGSINASTIGFGLGPRINAAGRLRTARLAFDLLVSEDNASANMLAEQLDLVNRERQDLMNQVVDKVFEAYERRAKERNVIVEFHESYHEGVVGLAASKVMDAFYRPTIIGHLKDGWVTASARSIPGFDITSALENASDLLDRFGGHTAAAGLRVQQHKVGELQSVLEQAFEAKMEGERLQPILEIDGVTTFHELDDRMLRFHDRMAPFGAQNQHPVLVSKNVRVLKKRTVGSEGRHLKLTLEQGGRPFDAIAFRMGDRISDLSSHIDVAYRLERNHYLGYVTLQLNVADFKPLN